MPNTTYTLGGWERVTNPAIQARIGVKDYGGPEVWAATSSTSYQNRAVTFTTGPHSTTATVYCYKPNGSDAAFFDDLYLVLTPALGAIPDQTMPENTPTGAIPLTLGNVGPAGFTRSATSDNTAVVPNGNIVFGGSGLNRTVTIRPATGQVGTAVITVRLQDPLRRQRPGELHANRGAAHGHRDGRHHRWHPRPPRRVPPGGLPAERPTRPGGRPLRAESRRRGHGPGLRRRRGGEQLPRHRPGLLP